MIWRCDKNMAGMGKYKEKEIIIAVWNIFSRGTVK